MVAFDLFCGPGGPVGCSFAQRAGSGVDEAQRRERARLARRFRHVGCGIGPLHHPLTERIRPGNGSGTAARAMFASTSSAAMTTAVIAMSAIRSRAAAYERL